MTHPNNLIRRYGPDDAFEGQSFVRKLKAFTLAKLEFTSPVAVAHECGWDKTNPQLVEVIRATVAGMGSGSAGAELVSADNRFTGDFIEYLHGQTIYFRLPLREVPANVAIKGQDGAATAFWVGESKGIGVTAMDTSTVSLTPLKVATIAVASKEWLRDSTPAGERLLRDELVSAARQKIDGTFFSTAAAVSGVSPAGIFNGVSAIGSNGVDAWSVREDLGDLMTPFIQAKNAADLNGCMHPLLAMRVALMTNSLTSSSEFPNFTRRGGDLKGINYLTGDNLPDDWHVLLSPSDIWRIGDTGIEISVSQDASLQMSDAPTQDSDTPTPTTVTSLFQTESVAFKIVQPMNFQKRRSHAAQFMTDCQYGESDTATA